MGSSRVEQALNELDPGSRAVVDLSLGTDFSDENIAMLIRVEPDEVARRRERAIDALQQKLGGGSHDDVVMELCAAMGVEPPPTMLDRGARNGSAAAAPNGSVGSLGAPAAPGTGDAEAADEVAEAEPEDAPGVVEPGGEPGSPIDAAAEPAPVADEPGELANAGAPDDVPPLADEPAEPQTAAAIEPETETEAQPEPEATPVFAARLDREPEAERGPERPPPSPPPGGRTEDEGGSGSSRRVGVLLAALLAGAIIVGGVIALGSGGGGSESEPVEPQAPTASQPADPPSGQDDVSATLDALPDAPAGGAAEVSLEGDELTIELDGLPAPEGTYEAWLFTSVLDSRPLGSTDDGSGTIRARLPAGAENYEYLDVSIQPSSNSQHSGQSIFRVPVADLVG